MDNRCICCGAIIPEDRQVCLACEQKEKERNKEPYCKGQKIRKYYIVNGEYMEAKED